MANSYYISEINVDGVKYNILDEQAKSDLLTLLGSHELQPLGDSAFKDVDITIEDASTGVPATIAIKNYVDDSIESLGVVLDFKGIKDTIAELPSTGNENGDVWLVRENTSEYIWVNDEWEEFGPAIDLSPYATISYVDSEINTIDTELTTAVNNINTINSKIPDEASSSNKLADKGYVDTSVSNSVTGIKGQAEQSYRTGNVELTPANIGALSTSGGTVNGKVNLNGEVTLGYVTSDPPGNGLTFNFINGVKTKLMVLGYTGSGSDVTPILGFDKPTRLNNIAINAYEPNSAVNKAYVDNRVEFVNNKVDVADSNINKLFPVVRNSSGLVAKQSIYNDIENATLVDLRVVCSGRIVGTGTQSISNPYSLEAITNFDITVSQNEDLTDGTIYNVNLQNSLYKFTYYLSTGLVEAYNIASVDLGTLNWEYDSENSFFYTDDLDGITFTPASSGIRDEFVPINGGGQVFCTSYAYANYRNGTLAKDGFCLGNGSYSSTTAYLLIKDSNYSDVATFKAAVSGQLLYYPIAEGNIITYNLPIITVQLFDGINYIYADGFNNIADYYSIPPYSTYMQKDIDYVTAGRSSDTSLGNRATAEGYQTTASGSHSHAEGYSTKATTSDSHAEGFITEASGDNGSHAEGNHTVASGSYGAHAEGFYTVANGERAPHAEGVSTSTGALSIAAHAEGWETAVGVNTRAAHAEGHGTIAASNYQHVSGQYNISDNSNTYAEIIGNGTESTRSNARTLDWSGNEWLAGKITVGVGPTNDMDVATKQYVDQAIAAALASLNQ